MSENNNKNIVSSTNSYSQALYELANESNSLKEIEDQVSAILKLISESLDFNRLIKDPTNKQEDQLNVINLISDKFKFNKLLNKFLNFIIIKRRIYFIEEILKIFLEICSNQRGEISQGRHLLYFSTVRVYTNTSTYTLPSPTTNIS